MRCVLVGNYGAGNLGDELLRESILALFSDVAWTTVSAHPGPRELPRLPAGFRSFLQPWHRTLRALRSFDAVVFGGGSLFTDVESLGACALWWEHAVATRVPILLAYQGVGPFKTQVGERLARGALRRAAFISVRDPVSAERLRGWKLNTEVIQTFDPVFSYLQKKRYQGGSKNVFVIIPRNSTSDEFWKELGSLSSQATRPRIVMMQPGHAGEQAAAERIRRMFPGAETVEAQSLPALADAIGDAATVLTQRYHGAVAALGAGVPDVRIVPQWPGDKLDALRSLAAQGENALRALADRGDAALRSALRSL